MRACTSTSSQATRNSAPLLSAENPRKPIEIPPEIHRLIDDLVADHLKVPETRAEAAKRFFEACAPENKDLRETLRPVIRNWMKVTDWFMDRTHDSGDTDAVCDAEEFRRKFELFESDPRLPDPRLLRFVG